jgi:hypothetical protein
MRYQDVSGGYAAYLLLVFSRSFLLADLTELQGQFRLRVDYASSVLAHFSHS